MPPAQHRYRKSKKVNKEWLPFNPFPLQPTIFLLSTSKNNASKKEPSDKSTLLEAQSSLNKPRLTLAREPTKHKKPQENGSLALELDSNPLPKKNHAYSDLNPPSRMRKTTLFAHPKQKESGYIYVFIKSIITFLLLTKQATPVLAFL